MINQPLVETRGRQRQEVVIVNLLGSLRDSFDSLTIDCIKTRQKISLTDCLMSAVAMFGLKYPSLLQFDKSVHNEEIIRYNLSTLYGVFQAPCDTYMRERLDELDPKLLRPSFAKIFNQLQRDKMLESYTYMDEGYIISIDGTGYFSSHEIKCQSCCEKHHRNGSTTYFHQMLAASLVSPEKSQVIPLCPEPIIKQDGAKKNDCELKAVKRLLRAIREDHPYLKVIIVEDALYGTVPNIKDLVELNMHYLICVKPERHKSLFDWLSGQECKTIEFQKEDRHHQFRYINNAPFGALTVNFLEYWEIDKNGKICKHFSWITDILINESNVYKLMRAGRARWKIENETFNTLKNQGYQFEHNFGHGYKYLSTVLAYIMMLAFLIDQAQAICCRSFQKAWGKISSGPLFWQKLRTFFFAFQITCWLDLYLAMCFGHGRPILSPNTS